MSKTKTSKIGKRYSHSRVALIKEVITSQLSNTFERLFLPTQELRLQDISCIYVSK